MLRHWNGTAATTIRTGAWLCRVERESKLFGQACGLSHQFCRCKPHAIIHPSDVLTVDQPRLLVSSLAYLFSSHRIEKLTRYIVSSNTKLHHFSVLLDVVPLQDQGKHADSLTKDRVRVNGLRQSSPRRYLELGVATAYLRHYVLRCHHQSISQQRPFSKKKKKRCQQTK